MEVIEIMNKYGILIFIAGLVACIFCGILKVPIAKKIRATCLIGEQDSKIAADRIRNVCNTIIVALSTILVGVWYIATEGITAMLTTKVYADILATFTVAKLIYMMYEGAGNASIKKGIRAVIDRIMARNNEYASTPSESIAPIDVVTSYLTSNVAFPLTDSQVEELRQLLEFKKIKQ